METFGTVVIFTLLPLVHPEHVGRTREKRIVLERVTDVTLTQAKHRAEEWRNLNCGAPIYAEWQESKVWIS